MTDKILFLYFSTFSISFLSVLILVPIVRRVALLLGVMDFPISPVKTHQTPTPYLGGVAIFIGITLALFVIRYVTHFPTGTLHSLRGILLGGGFIWVIGLIDDVKPGGISFKWKFFFQFIAAGILLWFGIRIQFIEPNWVAGILTIIWVVGITNAFNIIDIMDGLSSSQVFIGCLGFLFISLPTEKIYVNFAASAIAGACLAYFPYNLSKRWKIFMGDAGSLVLGFMMAALSLGTSYTRVNEIGLLAPFLILGLPIYDTCFVSFLRLKQGKSPFIGSKDHLALKLRSIGLTSRQVVLILLLVATCFSIAAYFVTCSPFYVAVFIFIFVAVVGLYVLFKLHKVKVN